MQSKLRPPPLRHDNLVSSLLVVLLGVIGGDAAFASAYVRLNQAGYITTESKRAVLLASGAGTGTFSVLDVASGASVFNGAIPGSSLGSWSSSFPDTYVLDLSAVTNPGLYRIQVAGTITATSSNFPIGTAAAIYQPLLTNALFFFQSQRDGPNVLTNVLNRKPCHLPDTNAAVYLPPTYDTSDTLIGGLTNAGGAPIDASGGWFDAGDYIKLVQTASYVEGMLLVALRDYPNLLGASGDFAGEARFGLDWLLKMWNQTDQTLYYAVSIGQGNGSITGDHDLWRLPEADDQLSVSPGDASYYMKYRPVFRAAPPGSSVSPNLAGRMAASFALASQVFRPTDPVLANRCLLAAQTIFDLAQTNNITELLTAPPYDFYPETQWRDDLEWGAVELYSATAQTNLATLPHTNALFYLQRAAYWANQYINDSDRDTLNLYDVGLLAHYELHRAIGQAGNPGGLAVTQAGLAGDIASQLTQAASLSASDPFGFAQSAYDSDPTPHALCLAIVANLYRKLTGSNTYNNLSLAQRDWVLGNNAWGSAFIVGAGNTFPHCMQDQIANLACHLDGTPPIRLGATVDGPNKSTSGSGAPDGANSCNLSTFNTFDGHSGKFRDGVAYWMTVEPAIDYTVPTILLFAQQIGELTPPVLQSPASLTNHNFRFNVSGSGGFTYVVQASSNLASWLPLQTNIAPFSFTDTTSIGFTSRFYRARYRP